MTQQRPIQPATTAPGTPHLSHPKYRADIDGLRAIAVLSVVAFHAFPGVVRGGFVGVDIFFVISGYLICTILFQNLERGSFSFTEFYVRRIRRIFPALVLVLVFVMVVGWFVLTADEYRQLGKQVAGGAGFVSNLLLWREAGYFDSSAEIKPLLHLWSLGIEEQFYLVWPCLLWFAWRRRFSPLTLTLVVAAASFCLNIAVVQGDMVAAFYSPVTRFWELLSGSLLAWWHLHRAPDRAAGPVTANLLSGSGLALLAAGFGMIHGELRFPGFWAAIPVAGALLVIAAGPAAWGNRVVLSSRICVWFGLISYPLYLWHWPLLSYARIVQGGHSVG
jgi:peptidoglycan/LPS O-acetylase OafA/YrhL